MLLATLIIFITGLFFGSFFGVLVDRFNYQKGILSRLWGRSKCDSCGTPLSTLDLVPIISIIFSRFLCRHCGGKVSKRYPLYELFSGLIFAGTFYVSFKTGDFSFYNIYEYVYLLLNFCLFYLIFLTDLRYKIIPDIYVLIGVSITLFYRASVAGLELFTVYYVLANDSFGKYLLEAGYFTNQLTYTLIPFGLTILGAVVVYLFFFGLFTVTRGRGMGGGDVKLSFYTSLFLGFPLMFIGTFMAFVVGSVVGLVLILLGFVRFKQTIPFGPFIVASAVVTYFIGDALLEWYIGLL